MSITILDSVTPGAFGRLASTSPDALAGYDDGRFNDIAAIEREYPGHRHQAIAVFPWDNGDWLDCEPGNCRPSDCPGWIRRQHARGLARPCIYAPLDWMPQVKANLEAAGISRNSVRLILPHYDGIAEIPAGYDGKQYTDHWEGRNVDASIVRDDFFELAHVAKAKPKKKHKRLPVIHRKVKAATLGASAGAWGPPLLHLLTGTHLTPAEAGGIATAIAALLGYLVPSVPGSSSRK